MPLPRGSGNFIRMNQLVMQLSTAAEFMLEDLMEALETEPSAAMTNLTLTFPPRLGFLFSSRW